ncbi:hypothetical protein [Ammoniphilus resinae]|uniref:hypothetical protein n=1 Tax=Ammoniphilus resinae TaxID=861532 RepID=UPI001AE75B0F|nr:hypothetical protein [Ammoniphilus resinae]
MKGIMNGLGDKHRGYQLGKWVLRLSMERVLAILSFKYSTTLRLLQGSKRQIDRLQQNAQ